MITRYRASLAGQQLDEINENIIIHNIQYSPIERSTGRKTIANLDGFEEGESKVNQRTVTITFEIHIYNTAERNAVCQEVNAWAQQGGSLKTNDREDQYLRVTCDQYAEVSSRDWTEPLTLVFTSVNIPYWMSNSAKSLSMAGKTGRGTLKVDGNTSSALVSVTVTAEAAVSSLQVAAGDNVLKLTGLSVAAGQQIVIDYLKGRYLRIRANGKSVLNKLTNDSSDNLKAVCGASTAVSFTANNRVSIAFSARGLWL